MSDNKKLINGKMRNVHTGKKGGKYYVSKGKKVYFGAPKRRRSSASSSSRENKRKKTGPKRSLRNLPSAIFGRCMASMPTYFQSFPQSFITGYTQAIVGPRAIDGTACEQLPQEYQATCKKNYCIREPYSEWCLQKKRDYEESGVRKRNSFWQEQCDEVAPRFITLQNRMRGKIGRRTVQQKRNQRQVAAGIFNNPYFIPTFNRLSPTQQRAILRSMGVRTMAELQGPIRGPRVRVTPFGKKKVKQTCK
tara:strand:+ start:1345 stop:2091 length:747 start_codon:yes stop_codon:yes gene_type:complete